MKIFTVSTVDKKLNFIELYFLKIIIIIPNFYYMILQINSFTHDRQVVIFPSDRWIFKLIIW